jgi:DnaJ-class molecular chaperone
VASPPPPRVVAGLPSTPEEARQLLGVAPRATRKEIDAAFRKASRKCHPDLVAHLDEDFQRLAHEKFLGIKRAHDILTRTS